MSQKPYWQCLATLDSMCAKGLLQFRSGLPHKYYTAVLCAADAQALALVETEFDANAGAVRMSMHASTRSSAGTGQCAQHGDVI